MSKIGIITFHCVKNYGAVLQAYALKETIKTRFDCKTNIIDYRPKVVTKPYSLFYFKSMNLFIKQLIISPLTIIKDHKFNKFMKKYGDLSNKIYKTEDDLKLIGREYDTYITGSDQVWNTEITGKLLDSYSLNFVDKSKSKISYAASIGNNNIKKKYLKEFKTKLDKLDAISVREESAKETLSKIVSKNISVNLDPVFLLSKNEWNEVVIAPKEKKNYILVYCLEQNQELKKIAEYLSEKTGLQIIDFSIINKYKNGSKSIRTAGPQEFIGWIKNADYIVTNSFHGTAFSIIYNKEFYTIPHMTRGSRMEDLLEWIGLKNRIVKTYNKFKEKDINNKIDYKKINNKIEKEKLKSINYLDKFISKKE